jgi:hypothetical protein
VGGTVTGVTQWKLEGRRAAHELERTNAAALHQGNLDHEQAERTRLAAEAEIAAVCRAAARTLRDDFLRAGMQFSVAAKTTRWWPMDPMLPLRVDPSDRRTLAARMQFDAWEGVAVAEGWIALLYAKRDLEVAEKALDISPENVAAVNQAMATLERARELLAPLAR